MVSNIPSNLFLSIVIPAYNEEKRIRDTLITVQQYLNSQLYSSEVIVVDDGSTDNTIEVVRELSKNIKNFQLIESKLNRGKGYAVRKGILAARGKYIGFTDADLSTPIKEINKALFWLNDEGYDIVIGSRGLPESHIIVHQPRYREIGAMIFNILVRLIVGLKGFEDTQCGFKFFKRQVARDIFRRQKINGFMFDVETLYIADKMGYKIKRIPVQWINDPNSKLRLVRDTLRMFKDLVRIRFTKVGVNYDARG